MNFPPSSSSYSIRHYPPPAAADDREHMFDKVVTPSDVGKLNRLVIPKQHAERFFPLHPAAGDKGLLLTFQDSGGLSWRFRYSYWSSSQSYVITKGWSRFVKHKTLLAGDLVSFHRAHGRFFIDWRRRLPEFYSHQLHHRLDHPSPFFYRPELVAGFSPPPVFWLSRGGTFPVESVAAPVVRGKAAAKRLRLFGVNMDCPNVDDDDHEQLSASLSTPLTFSHHHLVDHELSSSSNGVAPQVFLTELGNSTASPSLVQF